MAPWELHPILERCAAHFFPKKQTSLPMHITLVSDFETYIATGSSTHSPPVTERELQAAVESLNPKAAPGEDEVTPMIIKKCFPLIKLHLLYIMNACFELKLFPQC